MKLRIVQIMLGVGLVIMLSGCAKQFTRQRFDMIQAGVDMRSDVKQILGEPRANLEDQWYYEDPDEYHSAVIYFDEQGRVVGKEWIDAVTGEWMGVNPGADDAPEGGIRERHIKTRTYDD